MSTEAPSTNSGPDDVARITELAFGHARRLGIPDPVFELRVVEFQTDQGYRDGGTNGGYFTDEAKFAAAARQASSESPTTSATR